MTPVGQENAFAAIRCFSGFLRLVPRDLRLFSLFDFLFEICVCGAEFLRTLNDFLFKPAFKLLTCCSAFSRRSISFVIRRVTKNPMTPHRPADRSMRLRITL